MAIVKFDDDDDEDNDQCSKTTDVGHDKNIDSDCVFTENRYDYQKQKEH